MKICNKKYSNADNTWATNERSYAILGQQSIVTIYSKQMATIVMHGPQMGNLIQHTTVNCYNKQETNANQCNIWATN